MPQSYTCLYCHVVFSTKGRRPEIDNALQGRLYPYMGGIVSREKGKLLAIGGMPDHVHLLISASPGRGMSDLMRVVKTNSSKWVHETLPQHRGFAWQDGYGAFSVSASQLEVVRRYIRNQEKHHRRMTFEEEFVLLLKRHGIEYDERWLWR